LVGKLIPEAVLEAGRKRFRQVGKGNHFLELQVIEDIYDAETANAWGLHQGQVVFMYHSDSGMLGAFVGRIYAHRKKNTWKGRAWEWQIKLPFHLKQGTPARLPQRLKYHILPTGLSLLPASEEEGRRAWLAMQMASNYAYANRVAVLASLRDALRAVLGSQAFSIDLLWDSPHNSIRRERIEGKELWVHRHNAARVEPPSLTPPESPYKDTGHPVLLPGTEQIASFLCAAAEGARDSLHSGDHGAGLSGMRLGRQVTSEHHTRVYRYRHAEVEIRPHLSSNGVKEVMGILNQSEIARPVASLRPVAVLKA
jgi:tRNA-splicing ligase RtcB (3'-phosphate/5'-hydroxy nucleic acid ligase)